jgi:hypothetical protein
MQANIIQALINIVGLWLSLLLLKKERKQLPFLV